MNNRLKAFIRVHTSPYLPSLWGVAPPPFATPSATPSASPAASLAFSDSTRDHAVPYLLMLGTFLGRSFAVLVDEAAQSMVMIPVLASKHFFAGKGTVVGGDLFWEKVGNAARQVFLVSRLLRVAGVEVGMREGGRSPTFLQHYSALQRLFDSNDEDICRAPRRWAATAKSLAQQGRIVVMETRSCLALRPRRWTAGAGGKEVTQYCIDTSCTSHHSISLSKMPRTAFLLVESVAPTCAQPAAGAITYLCWARDGSQFVDLGLRGVGRKPLLPVIILPNERLAAAGCSSSSTSSAAAPIIALCELVLTADAIEAEVLSLWPARKVPDCVSFVEAVAAEAAA